MFMRFYKWLESLPNRQQYNVIVPLVLLGFIALFLLILWLIELINEIKITGLEPTLHRYPV